MVLRLINNLKTNSHTLSIFLRNILCQSITYTEYSGGILAHSLVMASLAMESDDEEPQLYLLKIIKKSLRPFLRSTQNTQEDHPDVFNPTSEWPQIFQACREELFSVVQVLLVD